MTPLIVKWGRGKTSLLPEVPKLGQHVLGTPSENRKFPQIVPQSSPDATGLWLKSLGDPQIWVIVSMQSAILVLDIGENFEPYPPVN